MRQPELLSPLMENSGPRELSDPTGYLCDWGIVYYSSITYPSLSKAGPKVGTNFMGYMKTLKTRRQTD